MKQKHNITTGKKDKKKEWIEKHKTKQKELNKTNENQPNTKMQGAWLWKRAVIREIVRAVL